MTDDLILLLEVEKEIRKRKRESDLEQYEIETAEREVWQETIQKGIDSFWEYCRLKSPKYYTEDKTYLKDLVETLQAFYEKRIIKFANNDTWQIVSSTKGLSNFQVCKKIMINIPPRHGKSRTLINFSQWVFGKNQDERIVECSYNDDVAGDFAKFTRDGIQEERVSERGYVFNDFFPNVKIKKGSNSYYKWALEGQFFNYLGAGIGGSITGKGGSILMIDDPIKLADEAFNENRLESIWNWYTGTFLSRGDAEGGEPLEIIVMTRWADGDLCGRILDSEEAPEWFVFKLEARDEETKKMLCETVLSEKRYLSLSKKMPFEIFRANYHQEPINIQGRLYKALKTYTSLPIDSNGKSISKGRFNYTDTADLGNDYLCSICYDEINEEAYIVDVYYTKAGMEITEPATAKMLVENKVNKALIESNNGGRGFARAVEKEIWEKHQTKSVIIKWFHQTENKKARILANSSFVMEHIYFPHNWKDRWPEFYKDINSYMKEGKNKNDDGPDTLTGIAENVNKTKKFEFGG